MSSFLNKTLNDQKLKSIQNFMISIFNLKWIYLEDFIVLNQNFEAKWIHI